MPTPLYSFPTIADTATVNVPDSINGAVQGIEDQLPYRVVATMAELGATTGPTHPDGQLAVLKADDAGVLGGSYFLRKGGKWLFAGGHVADLTTFLALLSSNIGTLPGAMVYDAATTSLRSFSSTTGSNSTIQEVGGSTWIPIPQAAGYENISGGAPFAYRAVPGGVVLRGGIHRVGSSPIPGATGSVIGNLPGGARPTYVAQGKGTGVNESNVVLRFNPDGNILVWAITLRTTDYIFLDGIFIPQGS